MALPEDLFAGFTENRFETALRPSKPEDVAATPLDLVEKLVGGESAVNGVNIQQITGRFLALDYGLSPQQYQAVRTFFETAKKVRDGAKVLDLGTNIARTLTSTFADVWSAVPILRTVVGLAQAVGSLFRIAKQASEAQQKAPDQALAYNQPADERGVNALLLLYNSGDWTRVFMPAQTDFGWTVERIEYAPGFLNQGLRYAPKFWDSLWEDSGLSCVPGLAEQMGIYEYPFEQPPGLTFGGPVITRAFGKQVGGKGSPFTPVSTAGTVHPSMRQMALTLWQEALKPSPQTFAIDTTQIADAWLSYFLSVRYGWQQIQADLPSGAWEQLRLQALVQSSASSFHWVPDAGPRGGVRFTGKSRFAGLSLSKLGVTGNTTIVYTPAAVYKGSTFGMEQLVAALVAQLRKTQVYALGTLACAYVDEDAPAIAGDRPVLGRRLDKMRKLLLEHPARCMVDLDRIKDGAYRSAMYDAQITCGGDTTVTAKGIPKAHRALPPIDPEGEPAPTPSQGSPVGSPTEPRAGVPTSVKVGAALGAAYLLRKPLADLFAKIA
jgi:hypothetical protein